MNPNLKVYKTDSKFPEVSLESGSYQVSHSRMEKWTCGLLCAAVTLSIVLGVILTFFIVTDGKLFLTSKVVAGRDLFLNSTKNSNHYNRTSRLIERPANKSEELIMTKCIDDEVDPCDDFYEFACGNYVKIVELPEAELSITPRKELESSFQRNLLELLLKSNSSSTEHSKALHVAKIYYQSCMKKEDDVWVLKDLLKDYGGWPVVKGEKWKSKTYEKLLFKNVENGISTNFIFDVFVDSDWKDPKRTKIYIDEPSFGLPSRQYLLEGFNGTKLQTYLNFQASMAKLLGAEDKDAAKIKLEKSLLFEIALAEVSQNADERRNKSKLYNPMSLKHLQKLTENMSWKEYVKGVLDLKELSDEEEIIVMSPKYLVNVDKILKKSKKRDVANYIIWRTILEAVEYMSSPDIQKINSKYSKSLNGVPKMEDRDSICGKLLTKNFPILSSILSRGSYVERNDSKISCAEELVDYVKTALKESINGASWIRKNVTREKASKKLNSTGYFLPGVREELLEPEFLEEYYRKLHLNSSDSFFDNQRKLVQLKNTKISRLHNGESSDSSVLDERKNNPFQVVYLPEENKVYLPLLMLDEREFGLTQPKFVSFGRFGASVGFGLSQALDDKGIQFTEKGILKLWFDKNSLMAYKDIMECTAKQYKYLLDDDNILIPTRRTRSKNWSDLSGISVAYKAYKNWKKDHREVTDEESKYTTNQFFWISYAHNFCTKTHNFTQYANRMMTESDSVPGKLRVNGPLRNLKEFSSDWKCPSKSKMNPTNKCLIW